ncbi:hypothetical protein BGZ96_004677 [Linnemannia gamsii]|uniref:Uncharacterized protein n=1 Tax=Linnemannia gamsii TaxID=64522 RepID=A0ABQ7JHW7_9FUNG|nr:hypothetical protein BGZ96_004677 [Linnemannia gamsii]
MDSATIAEYLDDGSVNNENIDNTSNLVTHSTLKKGHIMVSGEPRTEQAHHQLPQSSKIATVKSTEAGNSMKEKASGHLERWGTK